MSIFVENNCGRCQILHDKVEAQPRKRLVMKSFAVVILGILSSARVFAADPFVGTWAYDVDKSPMPTIKYTIEDAGGNQFNLTGSTGRPLTVKSDGVPMNSPYGGTVSFKKLDDRRARMVRADPDKMERNYSVSLDDKTLTLVDVYTFADGSTRKDTTNYSRLAPGKGLTGEWQSTSMKRQVSGDPGVLVIEPLGKDGLSLKYPDHGRLDLNFDGKQYPLQGRGVLKPSTTSGKRIDGRTFEVENYEEGKLQEREEYKVSGDSRTLTIVSRPASSRTVFTGVYNRR